MGIKKNNNSRHPKRNTRGPDSVFFYFPISDFYSTITAGPPCVPAKNNSHTPRSPYLPAIEIANGE